MEDDNTPRDSDDFLTSCTDENGVFPQQANVVMPEITETECNNIKANSGLDGQQKDNKADMAKMVCDIKQEVEAIATNAILNISANEVSKCQEDTNPTLASFWSRVLRYSQAVACILCAYDPFIATILKSGRYPQVLMGAVTAGGYPQWVTPDTVPTENSSKPITSGGIVDYVKEQLLGVWHLWEQQPEFTYFAQTLNGEADYQNLTVQSEATPPSLGDTALVANDGTDQSVLYTYNASGWTKDKVFTSADGLTNFAVTHILKGFYANNGVYYFHDGDEATWQVMDADMTELERKAAILENMFSRAILGREDTDAFVLTTRDTVAAAQAVPCTEGRTTLVFVTG